MRSLSTITEVLVASVLVTACQTVDDPHQGGFLNGVWNLTTGGYDSRISTKKIQVEEQQQEQAALDRQLQQLGNQLEQSERQLQEVEQRLAALDKDISVNRRQLRSETAKLTLAQTRAREIRNMLNQAQQANRTGGDVRDQTQVIQAHLSGLTNLVSELKGEGIQ